MNDEGNLWINMPQNGSILMIYHRFYLIVVESAQQHEIIILQIQNPTSTKHKIEEADRSFHVMGQILSSTTVCCQKNKMNVLYGI